MAKATYKVKASVSVGGLHGRRGKIWDHSTHVPLTLGIFSDFVVKTVIVKFSVLWKTYYAPGQWGSVVALVKTGLSWVRSCSTHSPELFRLQCFLSCQTLQGRKNPDTNAWDRAAEMNPVHLLPESKAHVSRLDKNQKSAFQSSWSSDRKEFSKIVYPADWDTFSPDVKALGACARIPRWGSNKLLPRPGKEKECWQASEKTFAEPGPGKLFEDTLLE